LANLKAIRTRIASVKSTQKITRRHEDGRGRAIEQGAATHLSIANRSR